MRFIPFLALTSCAQIPSHVPNWFVVFLVLALLLVLAIALAISALRHK